MSLTRRQTLSILGGGAVLAASAGTGYAVTRTPTAAIAPWAAAGGYDDPRKFALSYAILAPNPHNRQPWLVDLSREGEVTLYVDTDRLLPETDPFSRQIVIGLGCFLEVFRMAAAEVGFQTEMDLFPQGMPEDALDKRPVAFIRLSPGGTPDPLFAQVPHRRTLKEPYDTSLEVPEATLAAIARAAMTTQVATTNDPDTVLALRHLSHEALRIEIETPHTYKESVELFRIGHREVNANPDGIDFSGPLFEAMHLTGMFNREVVMDPTSTAYKEGLKAVYANADTAMAHIWQVTSGNSRFDQIAAGQDWVRLNLAATGQGVGIQPLSQALQEYPEMSDLYRSIHDRLAPTGGTVQMFARLGYAAPVAESPRWPLEAKIIGR